MSIGNQDHYLDFPFGMGSQGGIRITDTTDHIKDEILTVLLTAPGERINEPEFGCGLKELLFAPNNKILATLADFRIIQSLNRWMSDKILVNAVNVQNQDEHLTITIDYTVKVSSSQSSGRDQVVLRI